MSMEAEAETAPTILLVDDEMAIRDGLGQALESAGYRVAPCRDAVEAISWLRLHPTPSLMIGDVRMPGMDGFELRRRAAEMRSDLRVLLITGDPSVEIPDWFNGPGQVLRKPFTRDELIRTIGRLVDSSPPSAFGSDPHTEASDGIRDELHGLSNALAVMLGRVESFADVLDAEEPLETDWVRQCMDSSQRAIELAHQHLTRIAELIGDTDS